MCNDASSVKPFTTYPYLCLQLRLIALDWQYKMHFYFLPSRLERPSINWENSGWSIYIETLSEKGVIKLNFHAFISPFSPVTWSACWHVVCCLWQYYKGLTAIAPKSIHFMFVFTLCCYIDYNSGCDYAFTNFRGNATSYCTYHFCLLCLGWAAGYKQDRQATLAVGSPEDKEVDYYSWTVANLNSWPYKWHKSGRT